MNREKIIKQAVYHNWFKQPKESKPSYNFGGSGNFNSNNQGQSSKKGRKWIPRAKWLKMYWARKNSKK